MALKKIADRAFSTNIDIRREVKARNNIGEHLSLSTSTIYSAVPASIQQLDSAITFESEGIVHLQTHACYLNRYADTTERVILANDLVYDNETSTLYRIITIETMLNANRSVGSCHHIKLLIERVV